MVLYLLTKFGIIKAWTNIQSLRRFDLRFSQASKQIYRKLQYTKKVLGKFQRLLRFPRKMVLSFSSKFCIFVPFTNIQSHRRFDLSFRQTSEQVYRKPQHREKIFEKFQDQPRILRKMVLYSLTKFFIMKPWTNILWLRRFDFCFLQTSTSNKFIENSNIRRKF